MNGLGYPTEIFKNIFPDYASFEAWYKSLPISDGECPTEKTFSLIFYEYSDNHIASSVETFKNRFAIDIYTYFREFEETTKSILELMNLSDEDISVSGSIIVNTADIPENKSSTDADVVDFITSQQKNINKKGVLQIKREQLSNKRAFTVRTFINRFRHLFIRVISPEETLLIGEEGDM